MGCRLLQCLGKAAENKLDVTTDKSKDDAATCPAVTFTRTTGSISSVTALWLRFHYISMAK